MSESGAISQFSIRFPDWLALKCLPDRACAEACTEILKNLEKADRLVYAIRGEVLRLFDERQLYREFTDPATKAPCSGTYRFLEVYLPDTARYSQEALKNRQKLAPFVPLEAAAQIPRCNLRMLENASDSVKSDPEIQGAAASMSEKQFAQALNKRGQHVEQRVRPGWSWTASEFAEIEQYLAWVEKTAGLEHNLPATLLYLSIHENQEHSEDAA